MWPLLSLRFSHESHISTKRAILLPSDCTGSSPWSRASFPHLLLVSSFSEHQQLPEMRPRSKIWITPAFNWIQMRTEYTDYLHSTIEWTWYFTAWHPQETYNKKFNVGSQGNGGVNGKRSDSWALSTSPGLGVQIIAPLAKNGQLLCCVRWAQAATN